eukprot:9385721-Lingulodinium_polyedra.AAC.1
MARTNGSKGQVSMTTQPNTNHVEQLPVLEAPSPRIGRLGERANTTPPADKGNHKLPECTVFRVQT